MKDSKLANLYEWEHFADNFLFNSEIFSGFGSNWSEIYHPE